MPAVLARHYARLYGTRARELLDGAGSLADLGRHFGGLLYEREASYLCARRMGADGRGHTGPAHQARPASAAPMSEPHSRTGAQADWRRPADGCNDSITMSPSSRHCACCRPASAPIRCWCRRRAATPRSKQDGVLWIKASGTWLMNAARHATSSCRWRLAPLLEAVERDDPAAEKAAAIHVRRDLNRSGLRPSIETTVHALDAAEGRGACPLRRDDRARGAGRCRSPARERLRGFDWAFVPYRRPGLPLARGIAERLQARHRRAGARQSRAGRRRRHGRRGRVCCCGASPACSRGRRARHRRPMSTR